MTAAALHALPSCKQPEKHGTSEVSVSLHLMQCVWGGGGGGGGGWSSS